MDVRSRRPSRNCRRGRLGILLCWNWGRNVLALEQQDPERQITGCGESERKWGVDGIEVVE